MGSLTERSNRAQALVALGQSVWLDFISRELITSGELVRMVQDGWITGMTSNPTIFEKAISGSHEYDGDIKTIAGKGRTPPYEAFVAIARDDIRAAADALRPVYDATGAKDGYVSLEIPPGIESDLDAVVAEAKRLSSVVGRPNVMIKVPGTPEGVRAMEELTFAGLSINQTLLFSVDVYEKVAEAYIAGLKRRDKAGLSVSGIASVASFFVSRVDTAVDAALPEGSALRGKAAVANAQEAYKHFLEIFSGPEWETLAAKGAMVQRPLWASTGTKNPAYPDTLYVDELVAPDTVNTMPEATLRAVLDHGKTVAAIDARSMTKAERTLAELAGAGVDLQAVTKKLLVDGLASFEKDYLKLIDRIETALATYYAGPVAARANLGTLEPAVQARLSTMAAGGVVKRIWEGDHTVWKPDPTEISNRLGWLTVPVVMREHIDGLEAFAKGVAADGYTDAVLLGMGGSSLAPEVLRATFGVAKGMLDLHVLDTTDPAQIGDLTGKLDLAKTLFIVASKSGSTIETRSHLAYFWDRIPDGAHFVAITDPGTQLAALAKKDRFRRVFSNPDDIGGRYSALSFFGLVPAALIGVDIGQLLDRAIEMLHACSASVEPAANPGAWLGAVLGEAALAGRDKLTLVMPPSLSTLGYWIEQLVAESTGKEARGIVPVEGEPLGAPDVYGDDRLFVSVGDDVRLEALESAGHPVVRLALEDVYQLGAEFARWEFATAVAGYVLGINPFDQPNVQEAKDATAKILAGEPADASTDTLEGVLASVQPGDYIAICAYLPRNGQTMTQLAVAQRALRDRYNVATTVGFGPRYLHSTGQLHKGGRNNGIFIQVTGDVAAGLAIPGQAFTFGTLQAAQAQGDLASLRAHNRRAARVTLAELLEIR